jgi:probable rRNA maturation factor
MPAHVTLEVDPDLAVDNVALRATANAALAAPTPEGNGAPEDAALTIRIAGDALLQQLNRDHRGIDEPTDVLSFPAADDDADFPPGEASEDSQASEDAAYLGDVAISLPAAQRNSEATGTPLDRELRQLVTHGVLHLLGYDHEAPEDTAAMRAREVALLGDWVNAIWDAPPTH